MPGVTTTTTTDTTADTTTDTEVVKGDKDDPIKEKIELDPSSWMDKFDYKDFGNLTKQTSESLTKTPFMGAIGVLSNGQKAAQAAANIIIMKSQGYDTSDLETRLTKFRAETGMNLLPDELTNGNDLAKQISIETALVLSKDAVDLNDNPVFKDDKDYNNHRTKYYQNMPGLSGKTERSKTEVAKEQEVMSQPVVSGPTGLPDVDPNFFRDQGFDFTAKQPSSVETTPKPTAPKAPPVKTQAQKDADAKAAVDDWVKATQATKGKKGIERHKAIKAQSEASKKATKAIREKTGYKGFFKSEGGLMTKGKKKK